MLTENPVAEYALQRHCKTLAEGGTSDGWVTILTGTQEIVEGRAMRPYGDGMKRQERVIATGNHILPSECDYLVTTS